MLRAWLAALTTKWVATVSRWPWAGRTGYRTLNRVLSAAVDNALLGRNPLRGVKPPRVEGKPLRAGS